MRPLYERFQQVRGKLLSFAVAPLQAAQLAVFDAVDLDGSCQWFPRAGYGFWQIKEHEGHLAMYSDPIIDRFVWVQVQPPPGSPTASVSLASRSTSGKPRNKTAVALGLGSG